MAARASEVIVSRFSKILERFPLASSGTYNIGVRVRLKTDLSRYHASLKPGAEGVTAPPAGMWSRSSDRFCGVKFQEVTLDVLWQGLEVIDEQYLALERELGAVRDESIRLRTREATKYVGPQGGFRSLHVVYVDEAGVTNSTNIGFRDEAKRVEQILLDANIKPKVVTQK